MTRRPRAGLVLVLLLAIGSASCSAGADGDRGAAVPAASSTAGAVAIAVAPVGSERDPAATAAPVESAPPVAPSEAATATIEAPAAVAPTAPATAPEPSSLGVTATAQPACVRLGGTVEVRITTASRATLGLAAMYADHEAHGAMGFGEAGADGTYVWQVVVPADVPAGDASAIVGADLVGEDGSRRSGHAIAPFRVGAIGECP